MEWAVVCRQILLRCWEKRKNAPFIQWSYYWSGKEHFFFSPPRSKCNWRWVLLEVRVTFWRNKVVCSAILLLYSSSTCSLLFSEAPWVHLLFLIMWLRHPTSDTLEGMRSYDTSNGYVLYGGTGWGTEGHGWGLMFQCTIRTAAHQQSAKEKPRWSLNVMTWHYTSDIRLLKVQLENVKPWFLTLNPLLRPEMYSVCRSNRCNISFRL